MKRKYVVGYDWQGKFVILFDTNCLKTAMLIADKYQASRKEKIKVKKRA